jgi:Na+/H+-dicarboxylate symporter/ABC-type amino acid transport substrate-binding protein
VLAGAVLGIATGVLLGAEAAVLQPVGQLYVLLLEVAVYPYLICSLIHGLGSMPPASGTRLLRAGWGFYVGFWVLLFGLMAVLASGIPMHPPTALLPPETNTVEGPSLLELVVPSDFFTALSRNYVPAVVVFCLLYGAAFQYVDQKAELLAALESVRLASLKFWNGVVPFAPVAVFALFAVSAGTMNIREAENITLFLVFFFTGTLALAFWIVPALLATMLQSKTTEVLREFRSAYLIAVVTTLSVAALPAITAAAQRLLERARVSDPSRDEVLRANLSIAYPLGQAGNFFVYLFILFAAHFYRHPLDSTSAGILPVVTLLSCVGSPTSSVDAVAFLQAWLHLPASTSSLYVELMSFTRYGQVLASVAGFAFLGIAVPLAFFGKFQIRPLATASVVAASFAAMGGVAWIGGLAAQRWLEEKRNPYLSFTVDPALTRQVTMRVDPSASPASGPPMARIRERGEIRVGINASIIPFCYRNAAGDLAGYDISYAYQLASDLNVRLVFVPFEWRQFMDDMKSGRFDIAMAGIYVTEDRLMMLDASQPYFQSPLAFFMPRERAETFRTRASIAAQKKLALGVFDDPVLVPLLRSIFANAQLEIVPDYSTLPDFRKVDAAFWTLAQAEAVAAVYRELVAVEPSDIGAPFLFAYFMPPDSGEFTEFVNYWLTLKRNDGFEEAQRAYWLRRERRESEAPRQPLIRF